MKLVLKHEDEERTIKLPLEILDALWKGETNLVLACIGWDPKSGILSSATTPDRVTRSAQYGVGNAGMLNIKLSVDVRASEETSATEFLSYGTRFNR